MPEIAIEQGPIGFCEASNHVQGYDLLLKASDRSVWRWMRNGRATPDGFLDLYAKDPLVFGAAQRLLQ